VRTALLTAVIAAAATALPAQQAAGPGPLPLTAIDSLLAHGRLAAAERALYAAVEAHPRAPEARGALAWYLATRARFVIADVLFTEALRFGADSAVVASTRAVIAPFRARPTGPRVSVPFEFAEDGRLIGRFEMRGASGPVVALLDPNARGVAVANAAEVRRVGNSLRVAERSLRVSRVVVDSRLHPGEVRVGFDLLFAHGPVFDERTRTLTLGATDREAREARASPEGDDGLLPAVPILRSELPFVLAMPGLWLVERPGVAPAAAESPRGRALLRGARWWLDPDRSVVVIER